MSKNIVFEGWLTKSPPTKRIWRTRWQRRWFALRQSGELPGQYFLDYYADRNCRRLKGTINLDLCEQVDAGLHMERTGNGASDQKLRGSVFTIQTQHRTYHLEADCEADMEKWVDAICRVCGLRATDDPTDVLDTYQNNLSTTAVAEQHDCADSTGPYIPISECITGVRAQDRQAFTFDPKNIVMSSRTLERVTGNKGDQLCLSQPQRPHTDCSENDSNVSDDDCKSLNTSHSNIRDWSVAKTFTKLSLSQKTNGLEPPTPPPRPPKTLQRDTYQGPKIQEPADSHDFCAVRAGKRSPHLPPSPGRALFPNAHRTTDDEDDTHMHQSLQYCNLPSMPPAVDRALKPRHPSIGHIGHLTGPPNMQFGHPEFPRSDVLQYLDLDLHSPKRPPPSQFQDPKKRNEKIMHGKSLSSVDCDSAYKTVDFLKTEAFNITRQDAEASRSYQQ